MNVYVSPQYDNKAEKSNLLNCSKELKRGTNKAPPPAPAAVDRAPTYALFMSFDLGESDMQKILK